MIRLPTVGSASMRKVWMRRPKRRPARSIRARRRSRASESCGISRSSVAAPFSVVTVHKPTVELEVVLEVACEIQIILDQQHGVH
jgi:hypothetical protein